MDEQKAKQIIAHTAQKAIQPTSAEDLQRATGLPFIRSNELYAQPLSNAMQGKDAILVLLIKNNPNYGHWTLLLDRPEEKTMEFFDSFGNEMPDQMKQYLLEQLPEGYKVVYSTRTLQQKVRASQTCGRWVVFRYATKQYPLGHFILHMGSKIPPAFRDLAITQITT